jgi:hypothetical protein
VIWSSLPKKKAKKAKSNRLMLSKLAGSGEAFNFSKILKSSHPATDAKGSSAEARQGLFVRRDFDGDCRGRGADRVYVFFKT